MRKEDEFELDLELSIGGRYGKNVGQKRIMEKTGDPSEKREDSNNFSCENGFEFVKIEEEKPLISKGLNHLVFSGDKLFFEVQKFQARAYDRETRENEGFSSATRKTVQNMSSLTQNKTPKSSILMQNQCLFGYTNHCGIRFPGDNVGKGEKNEGNGYGNSSVEFDFQSCNSRNARTLSYGSFQGESCSDTGSHSSPFPPPKRQSISTSNVTEKFNLNVPHIPNSNPTEFTKNCKNNHKSSPKPPNQVRNALSFPRMPRVSTTGNGPNAKTITGFLYKYTEMEVTILCVCHGNSFTPSEFVEHAGGVDIEHPMRHITIVPFSGF